MITSAFEYIEQTQRFLREQKQEFMNPGDLLVYVNRARREVAGRTQCVRRLTPISGQIVSATVFNGGTTYTAPTVVISPPDFPSSTLPDPNGRQAVATATVVSGQINDIVFNDGGNGYFIPEITIVDPTGSGAQIQPVISPINTLNIGQEVYNFSDIYLGNWPGVEFDPRHQVGERDLRRIIVTCYRCIHFTTYQSKVRQYPFQYQYVPTFCSQFGQGAGGSFYAYPLPSQTYQWEFDCLCLPSDMLLDNSIPEVIPQPWTDAVPYMAAQLGYMELQNWNAAKFYETKFDKMTLGYS